MIQNTFEDLKLTGELPSPTGVGMQILKLTQGDDFSTEEIGRAISGDSALTGRLLKLANSAESGSVEPVTTVGEATVRLGIRTVRNMALGFSLVSSNRSGACAAFDYDGYWSISLARAVAAQRLSNELHIGIPAEMYILGLLSNVGSLALASVHPESYAELLTSHDCESPADFARAETQRFEINHHEVAALMLAEWGLPNSFAEAVREYEYVDFSQRKGALATTAELLQAANLISHICGAGETLRSAEWQRLEEGFLLLRQRSGLETGRFNQVCDGIATEWREWGQILSVPTNRPLRFDSLEAMIRELVATEQIGGGSPQAIPVAPVEPVRSQTVDLGLGGLHILAVDDDLVSLKMLERHLIKAGHRVSTATDGHEALQVALQECPHLVVADWMMPGLDGIELCSALRKISTGRKIYFIILTGRGEEDCVIQAFDAGVDDYVVKPFKPRILLARIQAGSRIISLQSQVECEQRKQRKQLAELQILTRKLRSAALTDPLTGLPNRRYAMKRLAQSWESSTRTGNPFGLIMMDIDYFKRVNDEFGHDAGDAVLKETSARLLESCREDEDVCRIGGEEFLVICANSDAQETWAAAERLRLAVEQNVVHWNDSTRSVTMSMGVAARDPSMANGEEMMRAADKAVYLAKDQGRNRVAIWGDEPPVKKSA